MSRPGRVILICYALTVAAACLWVPWKAGPDAEAQEVFLGYRWLWSARDPTPSLDGHVDLGRLTLEWVVLTALLAVAFLAKPQATSKPDSALAAPTTSTVPKKSEEAPDLIEMGNYLASIGRCDSCGRHLERPIFCCAKHRSAGVAYCNECVGVAMEKEQWGTSRNEAHGRPDSKT